MLRKRTERGLRREAVLDDEQVEQAVAVVVEDADVAGGAAASRTGAAGRRDVDELAAVVAEELRAPRRGRTAAAPAPACALALGVVGDVEFEGAVVVEVGEDGAAGAAEERRPAARLTSLERAVAEVAEQPVGHRAGGGLVLGVGPVAEAADEQVDAAVAVEVAPGAAVAHDAGERLEQPGLLRHVAKDDRVGGFLLLRGPPPQPETANIADTRMRRTGCSGLECGVLHRFWGTC